MGLRILAILLLALASPGVAMANDAGLEYFSPASWRPMKEHPTIALSAERISIHLDRDAARVVVQATYLNRGAACAVAMGFPEREDQGPEAGVFARTFSTWVEGTRAKVDATPWADSDRGRIRYWVKTVRFGAGQARRVRIAYRFPYAVRGSPPVAAFEYILSTGSSWHGAIGRLDVEVGSSRYRIDRLVEHNSALARFERRGNRLSWHAKDLEPGPADDIWIDLPEPAKASD